MQHSKTLQCISRNTLGLWFELLFFFGKGPHAFIWQGRTTKWTTADKCFLCLISYYPICHLQGHVCDKRVWHFDTQKHVSHTLVPAGCFCLSLQSPIAILNIIVFPNAPSDPWRIDAAALQKK